MTANISLTQAQRDGVAYARKYFSKKTGEELKEIALRDTGLAFGILVNNALRTKLFGFLGEGEAKDDFYCQCMISILDKAEQFSGMLHVLLSVDTEDGKFKKFLIGMEVGETRLESILNSIYKSGWRGTDIAAVFLKHFDFFAEFSKKAQTNYFARLFSDVYDPLELWDKFALKARGDLEFKGLLTKNSVEIFEALCVRLQKKELTKSEFDQLVHRIKPFIAQCANYMEDPAAQQLKGKVNNLFVDPEKMNRLGLSINDVASFNKRGTATEVSQILAANVKNVLNLIKGRRIKGSTPFNPSNSLLKDDLAFVIATTNLWAQVDPHRVHWFRSLLMKVSWFDRKLKLSDFFTAKNEELTNFSFQFHSKIATKSNPSLAAFVQAPVIAANLPVTPPKPAAKVIDSDALRRQPLPTAMPFSFASPASSSNVYTNSIFVTPSGGTDPQNRPALQTRVDFSLASPVSADSRGNTLLQAGSLPRTLDFSLASTPP